MTWSAQDFDMMTNGVKALENLSMPSSPLEYGEVASLLHPLIEAVNRLADNVGSASEEVRDLREELNSGITDICCSLDNQ